MDKKEYERYLQHRRRVALQKRRRRRKRMILAVAKIILLLLSFAVVFQIAVKLGFLQEPEKRKKAKNDTAPKQQEEMLVSVTQPAVDMQNKPDASLTLGSAGDVIVHLPITESYGGLKGTTHDFSPIFAMVSQTYNSVDYMVVNLETSLAGLEKGYSGFPRFNAPDEIATNLRDAGVDLQLLANNHIYDNGKTGFLRTISVMEQAGISYTGIRGKKNDARYILADVNGIRLGIVNYTYETEQEGDRTSLNGHLVDKSVEPLLNSFELSDLDTFYRELSNVQGEMYMQGAEFIILYIHWGNEYELEPNKVQKEMAQHFCDMGINAVIGSHPHVVQSLDVYTSTDGTRKMFCAYSLGNHLSNQRRERISSRPNGHTEDGLMLKLSISRIGGNTSITGVEAIPTYVLKNSVPNFYIIPIYQVQTIEEQTGMSGIMPTIQASYDRTMKILGNSLEDVRRELGILLE